MILVGFKKLDPRAKIPEKSTQGSGGMDVFCLNDVYVEKGKRVIVRTGIAHQPPPHCHAMVFSRSGLGAMGCRVAFDALIDSDYRGEIFVVMEYVGEGDGVRIRQGDRFCQLVYFHSRAFPIAAEALEETQRGERGFGSSGR